ncbi:hypothetical protein I350_07396 [Cryptococcus amylolentus CBS 6273]|uniref:ATP-binding cassette, subfamily B (MDR/TAP), member 1 n=1 Tax=Cryptococcus amylolentus CBS 6273 TaxID=1296118 RepID=A0A1E3JEG8_9TREE|nr:hypothetical protein I350_07396 [Cryptococcus amylolentus CBS 6273]
MPATHTSSPSPSTPRTPRTPRISRTSDVPDFPYPPVRSLVTPTSPPGRLPSTPRQSSREYPQLPSSPSSTLRKAAGTALPLSPSSDVYYSSPPSTYTNIHNTLRNSDEVELVALTPRQLPPSVETQDDSPFHDRHSVLSEREDLFEFESGRQRTMPGYKSASLSPQGTDGRGQPMSFGPMLDQVSRPPTDWRRSLYPAESQPIPTYDYSGLPTPSSPTSSRYWLLPDAVRPRFRRLFAFTTWRDYLFVFVPGVVLSIIAALIQPYMSVVIGDAFEIFAAYPMVMSTVTETDKQTLKDGVRDTCIKLTIAGVLALVLNYCKGIVWTLYGETVANRLRGKVFRGVQDKSMKWYDMGMGMREEEQGEGKENDAVGAGGLMTKFNRETDDVRLATSLSFGLVVQDSFTFLLCFILAVVYSPKLAFVTLSTIPLIVLTQIITQVTCAPLLATERRVLAEASTNIERATGAISTVKVHNAQSAEETRFLTLIGRGMGTMIKQGLVWGISIGVTDFFLLGTFVLGFWYGAQLVRNGSATSGDVMTCFWACLFAATYLQQVIPHLTTLTKGKNSMASLLTVIQDEPVRPVSGNPFSPGSTPTTAKFDIAKQPKVKESPTSEGLRPTKCHGEFNFTHVSFSYPSRPDNLVLRDVSLFIPPGETTFVVGGSGSGKSTIAQLLLRLYNPLTGEITLDDNSFDFLDASFTRENIAAVQQGCILFDMSVHDNVAMGLAGSGPDPKTGIKRSPKDVTREEVVEACKMAMIHDFVVGLPEGYETKLGTGGSSLSGGQRQRMAIARARIRDPTVLILDEATSALDATSRVLVFQNIKAWRNNRTTIVITHDLSQIVSDDFVYVMKDGIVAEQGFRLDLVKKTGGVFANIAAEQAITPFPAKDEGDEQWRENLENLLNMEEDFEEVLDVRSATPAFSKLLNRNSGVYNDMYDEYSRGQRLSHLDRRRSRQSTAQKRLSWTPEQHGRTQSRQTFVASGGSRPVSRNSRPASRMSVSPRPSSRMSLRTMMADPDSTPRQGNQSQRSLELPSSGMLHAGWTEKSSPGQISLRERQRKTLSENLEDDLKDSASELDNPHTAIEVESEGPKPIPGTFVLIKLYFPTLPHRYLLFFGCLGSIGHGATTPIWSYFLAKLMTIVGAGGADVGALTKYGLIVLALCACQGLSNCVREYSLVSLSARWSHMVRGQAYHKLIKQDKAFFDLSPSAPSRLVQLLIKDADDARTLMSHVIGKAVTVVTMLGLGIFWAMAVEWRLTLIGLALGPIFGGCMALNSWMLGNVEVACKTAREDVGRVFYESVANVRGIRAMALDGAFEDRFATDAKAAKSVGKRSAWNMAIGGAIGGCLPLFAQAIMNFAGSEFMIQGRMNYEEMLQVYNLVLFSLTFGAGLLDFIPMMAKARVAARDFNRLLFLGEQTTESEGELRMPINGHIAFNHVAFSYPSRPEVPILTDVSFTLTPGECVAIVGPSGSGKSTIAALMQRLYMVDAGEIRIGNYNLKQTDVVWLRNHIAVVSQSANLFDASIAENIAYGTPNLPLSEIYRAAQAANIHDFIQSLPQGYDTNLGENASSISGGQAQRLQIARALCRTSRILILDECTSALDTDNAKAVLDTIVKIKAHRTTVFITHSVEAMQRCDRIICLGEGRVEEEGTFEDLVRRGGVFAQLMKTGEWE